MTIKNLMGIIWKIEALIRYNSLIYGLQKLPVIGKKIPNRCYQIGAFKVLAMLVQFLLIPLQLILSMVLYVLFAWCLSLGIRSWLTAYSWYSSSGTFQTSLVIISLFPCFG
ncbi:hypothetical protein N1495_07050 [Streptococcus didelphis]|uniref:Uncharacterized protein n=1 Tax=Streptococcus didelphis TaxID=102886 RepID=A0ABY9LJX5_9STRE|nr:hypothetical protein [Streptococcus didelphis]WMB28485.1 hypothetical protein N1496_02620 [Streptococcus didelphis]WMB29160.1 hypothetical protein N1495_07050 [Streptococcus didelphis]